MKIVVLDGKGVNPGDMSWAQIEQFGTLTVYERTSQDMVLEHCGDAEIVLTNKTVFSADTIARLENVRYIGVLATGYNVVDLDAARERGIVVTNIPAYSTDSVAQFVFAHILNVTSHVDHYARESRDGVWGRCKDFCYWDVPLMELAGKTIGIVGLGNIGTRVAQMANVFGLRVLALTSKRQEDLPEYVVKAGLDELLAGSDIVTLHCPLTIDTRGMIDGRAIGKMKKGAILVNTGRGPLVNEQDVSDALEQGRLGAYCADVMCMEPPSADNPLFRQSNAYITPHVAWASVEARTRLMNVAEANIRAFLEGHPQNVVNA